MIVAVDSDGLNPYGRMIADALRGAAGPVAFYRRRAPVEPFGRGFGPVRGGEGRRLVRAVRLGGALAGLLAREQRATRVLLMWETLADALLALGFRARGCRVVATVHDPRRPGVAARLARLLLARIADVVVMHSEPMAERLIRETGLPRERIRVLPHPAFPPSAADRTDARASLGLEDGDRIVLFFGQLRPYKGLDILAAAMETVLEAAPAARLLIAGTVTDSALVHPLVALARETGRVDLVTSSRPLPESAIEEALAAADLVVLPFSSASQSGSVVHALARERAVVTTTVGDGARLAAVGAVRAVPPQDRSRLADACLELLTDDGLRTELARAGSAYAHSELDQAEIGRRLAALLETP